MVMDQEIFKLQARLYLLEALLSSILPKERADLMLGALEISSAKHLNAVEGRMMHAHFQNAVDGFREIYVRFGEESGVWDSRSRG